MAGTFGIRALIHAITLSSLLPVAMAQSCTTTDCTSGCLDFDGYYRTCNRDYQGLGDSLTSCVCHFGGVDTIIGDLNHCVACDTAGLTNNPLEFYQGWTVICDAYKADGESVAQSLAAVNSTVVAEMFSTTFLPPIQSELCGGVAAAPTPDQGDGAGPTPTPDSGDSAASTPTPGSLGGSTTGVAVTGTAGSSSLAGTTAGASVTGTGQPAPATTNAALHPRAMAGLLGLPVAVGVLLN